MSELAAEKKIIKLGTQSLAIHLLSSGQKQVDTYSIECLLGKTEGWIQNFNNILSDNSVEYDYGKELKEIEVIDRFGWRVPLDTIPIENFIKLATTEAINGNILAIEIISVFAEIGVKTL